MRSGAIGLAVFGALVALALWSGPVPFLFMLFGAGAGLTVKRMRQERRLGRTIWRVLTGKNPNN